MKKKTRIKIKQAHIKEVKPLGPDKHLVKADNVEFELHGAPPPPSDPLPDEPICFERDRPEPIEKKDKPVDKKSAWQKWCEFFK